MRETGPFSCERSYRTRCRIRSCGAATFRWSITMNQPVISDSVVCRPHAGRDCQRHTCFAIQKRIAESLHPNPLAFAESDSSVSDLEHISRKLATAPIDGNAVALPGYRNSLSGHSVQDLGTLRVDHDSVTRTVCMWCTTLLDRLWRMRLVDALSRARFDAKRSTERHDLRFLCADIHQQRHQRGTCRIQSPKAHRHSNTTLDGFLSSIGFDQSDIDAYGAVVGTTELATFGHPAMNFSSRFATFQQRWTQYRSTVGSEFRHVRRYPDLGDPKAQS